MYSFGKKSKEQLETADKRLQDIAEKALSYGVMDFSVREGHRTIERQKALFAEGLTQIDGTTKKGKHNYYPSLAIDIVPFPDVVNGVNIWEDAQRFSVLAGLMYAAAAELGHKIRWGGDWDSDGNNADSKFNDYPHFELL